MANVNNNNNRLDNLFSDLDKEFKNGHGKKEPVGLIKKNTEPIYLPGKHHNATGNKINGTLDRNQAFKNIC